MTAAPEDSRDMTAPRRSIALALLLPLVAGGAVALSGPAATAATALAATAAEVVAEVVEVEVLSGRGDLVTGGDALVRVSVPRGTDPARTRVDVDGRDVTGAFVVRDGDLLGLVEGLPLGDSVVSAALPDGSGARLTVTNAPIGGPVFSGPQIEPWTCAEGAEDEQCNREPTVTFLYKSTRGGSLRAYDPDSPPSDVATTTTDDGEQVPFIVREETGVSLRDQYRIAALHDPAAPVDPTAENPGFNNKLVLNHGVSCDTSYEMGTAPDVRLEDALSQGFAVASHALDHAGHNCNMVTQAESLIVTKEMVAERFGPLRYTIGSGCSGGSLVQQQVANAYPGVYQGITPQCSFTDAWSSAQQYVDYVGLRDYLEDPATLPEHRITPAQWPSIFGHANPANQITFTEVIPNSGDPSRECPGVPEEDVYDENTNPDGVRCTLHDYMRNVFGVDEQGKARRPISNVGIQYGLSGLLAGLGAIEPDPTRPPLTVDQFVALNAGVGGYDLDFNRIPQRTASDPLAQERVYRSGAVNTGAHLDQVAILDLGGPEPGAFHDVYRKHSMRDRLIREHGTADNQVFWEGQTPLLGDPSFKADSITAMDEWLSAVEADQRDVPLAQKILDAKEPAGIGERCVSADGADAPLSLCDATVDPTIFSSPRIEAGGGDPLVGFTDDRLDCETVPLEDYDYAGRTFAELFTAAQQEALRAAFPTGVCDYTNPGKGFQDAVAWLTYQDDQGDVIHGGEPMGPAPVSVPFGPTGGVCAGAPQSGVSDRDRARDVHRAQVDCVLHLDVARGTSATTYSPTKDVTRAQMASFLVNALREARGLEVPKRADAFDDVAGSVHRDSINALAQLGIAGGQGDGGYDPDATITRDQMASFLVRTARLARALPEATGEPFRDIAGSVHAEAIDAGYQAGLFRGTAAPVAATPRSGTFSPGAPVARDQMATFLVALFACLQPEQRR